MRAELIDCEETILREIADPAMTRRDVAQTYSLILQSHECRTVSWPKVNGAILARWDQAALFEIKRDAHSGKCFK